MNKEYEKLELGLCVLQYKFLQFNLIQEQSAVV